MGAWIDSLVLPLAYDHERQQVFEESIANSSPAERTAVRLLYADWLDEQQRPVHAIAQRLISTTGLLPAVRANWLPVTSWGTGDTVIGSEFAGYEWSWRLPREQPAAAGAVLERLNAGGALAYGLEYPSREILESKLANSIAWEMDYVNSGDVLPWIVAAINGEPYWWTTHPISSRLSRLTQPLRPRG